MLEKQIEKRLVDQIKRAGGIAYKFVSPANRGVPDRLVLMPNAVVCFVECKSSTGKLTTLQGVCINAIRDMGFRAEVVNSIEQVDLLVGELRGVSDGR